MRRCQLFGTIALLVSTLSTQGQDQSGQKLPSGLRIPATLKTSLSSDKAKPGDTIKLDVFSAVHGKDGKVLIPAHATLTGTVTQASAFHGADHPAILAFAVQRAEWKGGQGMLDAPVFGVLALSDFKQTGFAAIGPKDEYEMAQFLRGITTQGETVEGIRAATLRNDVSLDIGDQRTLNWVPGTPLSSTSTGAIMKLQLSTDPAVRTYFTADKRDVELPREFMVVLLNGMKVVQ
jgi:hypothetical protein